MLCFIARRHVVACLLSFIAVSSTQAATLAPPAVRGTVTDSTGAPISSARIIVLALNRSTTTDESGKFEFRGLPAGVYHVTATRIGFAPSHVDVTVPASGSDVVVAIRLRPSAVQLSLVQVTATPTGTDVRDVPQSVAELSAEALSRSLGTTIAQTLSSEPGLSVRFNGPAAQAPVIRGLQGDRVLVLQDGSRASDLSSSAPDHAISIDPLTAERVEVVRGPASLLYGNQALGGVVNVISNDIPTAIPDHIEGTLASQAESAAPGASVAGGMTIPTGRSFAIIARAGGRHSDDQRMGGGDMLANSFFRNYYGTGGFGFATERANGGVLYRYYHNNYGLPTGGDDRARIEGARKEVEGRSDFTLPSRFVNSLRVSATGQWYGHDEINQLTSNINTSFNLKTQTLDLLGRTKLGRVTGALGASGIFKQYASTGDEALTPAANSNGAGAFIYEEVPLRDTKNNPDALVPKLQLGGRYDLYDIKSLSSSDPKFGPGRNVNFKTFSGSMGVSIPVSQVITVSGSVARAFRAPTVEEMFSNAFHEALGTFDVGNPLLKAEINQGGEVILKAASTRVTAQLAAYRNTIQNFITPNVVGDTVIDADGAQDTVPLNRISQANARLYGAEGRVEVEAAPHFVVGAMGDLTRGEFAASGVPLGFMPPARLGGLARWDDGTRSLSAEMRHAFQQDRVPPAVSADDAAGIATAAYNLLNLSAGYVFKVGGQVSSITFRVDNALDEKYQDATSRIKTFAFNPGRNFALVYKTLF